MQHLDVPEWPSVDMRLEEDGGDSTKRSLSASTGIIKVKTPTLGGVLRRNYPMHIF